jgi:hypothetical protein
MFFGKALTSLGSKAMVKGVPTNMGPGDAFCTGKYRLKEVVGFTEPGEMMGTRVSHVTHTYALEGAEDWAKSAAVSIFPGFGDGLGKEHREDTMMVLRNDGWVDSRAK